MVSTWISPNEIICPVALAATTLQILKIGLTFFQNSLLRGREVGPAFSLAASFAVSVDVGFLAAPLVSWDIKFALSDLTSDEVAGDFSAPYRVKKKN